MRAWVLLRELLHLDQQRLLVLRGAGHAWGELTTSFRAASEARRGRPLRALRDSLWMRGLSAKCACGGWHRGRAAGVGWRNGLSQLRTQGGRLRPTSRWFRRPVSGQGRASAYWSEGREPSRRRRWEMSRPRPSKANASAVPLRSRGARGGESSAAAPPAAGGRRRGRREGRGARCWLPGRRFDSRPARTGTPRGSAGRTGSPGPRGPWCSPTPPPGAPARAAARRRRGLVGCCRAGAAAP